MSDGVSQVMIGQMRSSSAVHLMACVGAAAVVLGSLLAPVAGKAAQRPVSAGSVNAQLLAKGPRGYSIELRSEGGKLQLIFSHGLFPSLVYTFHGRVSAKGIEAKIGDLGSIDMRFVPAGKSKRVRPPGHCSGPVASATEGHFVGSFHFRAERGVAKVDLSHARGSIARPGWHCAHEGFKRFAEGGPEGTTYTILRAAREDGKVGFAAFTGTSAEHPDPVGAEVSASMTTRRGPVRVDHLAVVLGRNIFSFESALTGATVAPHGPFRGSATYCASCAPESRWTGDLEVVLPGVAGEVPLVGAGFGVKLESILAGGRDGSSVTG